MSAQDVLCSICSFCSMYTNERVHAYCHDVEILKIMIFEKLVPDSSLIILNNTFDYMQNEFDDEIKYNSIN